MSALSIRRDRTPVMLRKLAKGEPDARVARRTLAIANALDGMSRKDAARSAGHGSPDAARLGDPLQPAWHRRAADRGAGSPAKAGAEELAELYAIVMAGPTRRRRAVCAFTREDLVRICEQRFGKTMHVRRWVVMLRDIGLSRQKARPSHPQKDPASQEAFKKSPAAPQKTSAYA